MENIKVEIDGKTVQAPKGSTILQAARSAGVNIPTLCNNDGLEPYGSCRMCMVEIQHKGRKKLVASCLYPVEEGLSVQTNTEKVRKIRKTIIELLWPAFQQYGKEYGVNGSRFRAGMTDCSLCGLCVRYCSEVKKANVLYFKGRGIDRKPALVEDAPLSCSGCRECYNLCTSGWVVSRA
jgi:NADH dehydrogenase/NADH:ubiquinone oxidoreductase subunit G